MIASKRLTDSFGAVICSDNNASLPELDRDELIDLFKARGVVLFLDFKPNLAEFERFGDRFCRNWMSYQGGAYEKRILNPDSGSDIISANRYTPEGKQLTFRLDLHSDMSYLKNKPAFLLLYSVQPAQWGGDSLLCDGADVCRHLSEDTRTLLTTKRIKYKRKYPDGNWQVRFQTNDLAEVHRFAGENDLLVTYDDQTGTVRTEFLTYAIVPSRWGGHQVFCNSIMTFLWLEQRGNDHSLIRLEDDSPIPADVIAELREVTDRLTVTLPLKQGDFAWIDNTRLLHGRTPYDDPERDLAQRLAADVDW